MPKRVLLWLQWDEHQVCDNRFQACQVRVILVSKDHLSVSWAPELALWIVIAIKDSSLALLYVIPVMLDQPELVLHRRAALRHHNLSARTCLRVSIITTEFKIKVKKLIKLVTVLKRLPGIVNQEAKLNQSKIKRSSKQQRKWSMRQMATIKILLISPKRPDRQLILNNSDRNHHWKVNRLLRSSNQ